MATNGIVDGIEVIPITPQIEELARYAVENQKTYPNLVFRKVVSARQQVVSGMLYYITLEAAEGELINSYETKVLVKEWLHYKEVVEFKRLLTSPHQEPHVSVKFGGIKVIPDAPTNHEVIELARFAVDEHNKKEKSHLVYKRVVNASEQVVAGLLYRITLEAAESGDHGRLYEAKVLLPAGLPQKILLEFKPLLIRNSKPSVVVKLGEPVDIPDAPTNLEIIELARFAVAKHNKEEKTNLQFKRVVKASEQVVAGFLYRIFLEAAVDGGHDRFYEAKVFFPAGINVKVLIGFKALLQPSIRYSGVGQEIEIPDAATNLEVIWLARFAVDEQNKKEFKRVLKAREQVVSGFLYHITLEASIDETHSGFYEAHILLPPAGIDQKVLLGFEPVSRPSNIHGGLEDIPDASTNPEIIAIAVFAVDEYNKEQGKRLEFKQVVSAQKQVVAGMKYYVDLIALENGIEHKYKAEVWVKPWENFKKLLAFELWAPILPGPPKDVPDASTNPEIIALAVFAVDEYNKEKGKSLEFKQVLSAQVVVVAGEKFYIDLIVLEDGHDSRYRAEVWVKPWENFKKLLSFDMFVGPISGA